MSNIFNSTSSQNKVMDLIGGKIDPGKNTESIFPSYFVYKQDQNVMPTSSQIATKLKEIGVTLIKQRTIPSMVPLNAYETGLLPQTFKEIYDDALESGEVPKLNVKVNLPVGEGHFIPKFDARYTSMKYDMTLYQQIIYQAITNPSKETYESNKSFVAMIDTAARQFTVCSGTPNGQISRLAQMQIIAESKYKDSFGLTVKRKSILEIFANLHKNNQQLNDKYPNFLELGSDLFFKYYPVFSVESDQNFPGLLIEPSAFVEMAKPLTDEEGNVILDELNQIVMRPAMDYWPTIGKDRLAGLPFIGKNKGDVITETAILTDSFYNNLFDIINSKEEPIVGKTTESLIVDLLEENWYMGAGLFMPKAEPYEKRNVETKTRNLWSMSVLTHVMAGIINGQATATSPNMLDYPCNSLYRFSPFHGGMDKFIKTILSITESQIYVYADNIYLIYLNADGTIEYYSFDLDKAEAQITQDDAMFYMYYILTRSHCTVNGIALFNMTWAIFATQIYPKLVVDGIALFGNIQFILRGQGSGNGLTYNLNQVGSSKFAILWDLNGKPKPGTPAFEKVLLLSGTSMKMEVHIKDFKQEVAKAVSGSSKNGMWVDGTDKPPTTPPYIIDMDLLGYSAFYSPHMDMMIPTLALDRLSKSIILPKASIKDLEGETLSFPDQYYRVARYEAMRMLGATNFAIVDDALKHLASTSRASLIKLASNPDENLMRVFQTLDVAQMLSITGNFPKYFEIDAQFLMLLHTYDNRPFRYDKYKVTPPTKSFSLANIANGETRLTYSLTNDLREVIKSLQDAQKAGVSFDYNKLRKNAKYESIVERTAKMNNILTSARNYTIKTKLPATGVTTEQAINPNVAWKIHQDSTLVDVRRNMKQGPTGTYIMTMTQQPYLEMLSEGLKYKKLTLTREGKPLAKLVERRSDKKNLNDVDELLTELNSVLEANKELQAKDKIEASTASTGAYVSKSRLNQLEYEQKVASIKPKTNLSLRDQMIKGPAYKKNYKDYLQILQDEPYIIYKYLTKDFKTKPEFNVQAIERYRQMDKTKTGIPSSDIRDIIDRSFKPYYLTNPKEYTRSLTQIFGAGNPREWKINKYLSNTPILAGPVNAQFSQLPTEEDIMNVRISIADDSRDHIDELISSQDEN